MLEAPHARSPSIRRLASSLARQPLWLLALALTLASCVRGPSRTARVSPGPTGAPADAARAHPEGAAAATASAPSVDAGTTACDGPGERLFGTTCCTFEDIPEDEISPGTEIEHCAGPQIGKPCRRAGDCDVTCSCDSRDRPPRPADDPQGPAVGTRGVVGWCSGSVRVGVFTCVIDDTGAVSRRIVD